MKKTEPCTEDMFAVDVATCSEDSMSENFLRMCAQWETDEEFNEATTND